MKQTILLQLDTDPQPSVFDAVVALDAGVENLLRHGGVNPGNVRDLVHGALFTRGLGDLHRTAIFIGGSQVSLGEAVLEAVKATFFGPFRVSVLLDCNGANTTAAAAVLSASEGLGGELHGARVAVLGGTGPVGQRVVRLLQRAGAMVTIGCKELESGEAAAQAVRASTGMTPDLFLTESPEAITEGIRGSRAVINAAAAGVLLLSSRMREDLGSVRAFIDLNAVPPLGIEGVEPNDKGAHRGSARVWGALGVGGLKMKIHRRAIEDLFAGNDRVLDAEEVFALGRALLAEKS